MYKINKNYFEEINNPNKAYWLGFIAADGGIYKNRLSIELNYKDDEHLKKFLHDIDSPRPLRYRTRKNNIKTVILEINNIKIAHDLFKYNIIPNKTYNLIFPNIPTQYYRDYIRGFYDGDGTYVCTKKNVYRKDRNKYANRFSCEISCVCKCKNFLISVNQILENNNIKCRFCYDAKSDLYYLRLSSKEQMSNFINYIYYDDCLMLERKKQKMFKINKYCLT